MRKILFFICTPYQLLVSMRIILEKHKNDVVDLLLSDSIANVELLVERLNYVGLFNDIKIVEYKLKLKSLNGAQLLGYTLEQHLKQKGYFSNTSKIDTFYNKIYFSNTNIKYDCIFKEIKNLNANREKLELHIIEDGFSTYAEFNEKIFCKSFKKVGNIDKLRKIYRIIQGCNLANAEMLHVFSPELLEWKPQFGINEIPKIGLVDIEYLEEINKIFDYENTNDQYKQNVIFFEESYYADKIDVADEKVVDLIVDVIGKDDVLIKIHPRNPINRFEKKGYITNKNTTIPWEVIAQNIDLNNKILVTIASGSALTTLVNMNIKPQKIVMLMNCEEIDDSNLTPTLPMLRKLAKYYKEDIFTPKTMSEFKEYLMSVEGENL